MRAAVFKCVGLPLVIETRPDPVPASDEVVIRVGRCGICGTDLSMTDGSGQVYPLDSVIGHEFAGEVVASGTQVTGLKVGDRITALPYAGCGRCATCLAGRPNFCAQFRGLAGGFGQFLATPERVAVKLPGSLTLADGALVEPLAVSLHGVVLAQMPRGARVLVIGAGPIGLGAVYWARRLGASSITVIARTRRAESLAMQMGANNFVMPDSAEDWVPVVSAALGGLPDVVIEAVGKKEMIARAVNCVKPCGTVVVLGFCSVPDSFIPAEAVWKEVTMRFSMTYSIAEFEQVARVLDAGDVECRAMVTDTVRLAELPAVFESLRRRTHGCKVLVSPWE
jgi:(R,R)-butanediol dehydrogenase/meso-butanediol dehydrogenase/diacetyl reductase